MATLESLQTKIAKLQAQAAAIAKKDSSVVIAKIRDLMEMEWTPPPARADSRCRLGE
jgi:hypothetical protein